MFMELLKLLKRGDLFLFFLFKTCLPKISHQAQDKAVQSLAGSPDFLRRRFLFSLDPRPNVPSSEPPGISLRPSVTSSEAWDPPCSAHVSKWSLSGLQAGCAPPARPPQALHSQFSAGSLIFFQLCIFLKCPQFATPPLSISRW